MVFEENSELISQGSLQNCDLTIMDVRLDGCMLKQAFRNREILVGIDSDWDQSLDRLAAPHAWIETTSKMDVFGLDIS